MTQLKPEVTENNTIACEVCDLLITLPTRNQPGKAMHCPRCHHHLSRGHSRDLDTVIALSVTAVLTMIGSVLFTFIGFSASGQQRNINLLQTVSELLNQGYVSLSLMVLLFILIFPACYLIGLLILTLSLRYQGTADLKPYRLLLGKTLVRIRPWIMTEVFIFGVLVSLIKMVEMANVQLGSAFWAYLLFTGLFSYILLLMDNQRLWRWIGIE